MAKDRPFAAIQIETDPDVPTEGAVISRTDRIIETGRAAFDSALDTSRAALGSGRVALDTALGTARGTGRVALDRAPEVAGGARLILARAQDQVDDMSDMGVVAAAGFSLGLTFGLMVAGVPRAAVIVSAVPVALTVRSALARGLKPSRLAR